MKKLLQINPVVRTNTSTGRIMKEIAQVARANGWETYIAYGKGRDGVPEHECRLIPVGGKFSVFLHGLLTRILDMHGLGSNWATYRFVRKIRELKPDLIHIHNIHGYFLNYRILFEFLCKSQIPVIWTVHDCWLFTGHCYHYTYAGCRKWMGGCHSCPQKKEFPTSWFVDRSAKNYRDKKKVFTSMPTSLLTFIPVSRWMESEMKQSFLKNYPMRVIYNGIDTETFNILDSGDIRERYNLGNRHILLGVASIWMPEKGWNDFIQISGMLADDEIIVLVGVEENLAAGLPHNIIAIRRTGDIAELARLYSTADVFLNPTWQDNYPTVNLEAISCGTPVVTYRTGGSIESVNDATGIVVPRGDVEAMYNAVKLIEKKGKAFYQKSCRNFAAAHFRKQDCYAEYLKLYNEMMAD